MLLNKKQLNIDQTAGGGYVATQTNEVPVVTGFAALSTEMFEPTYKPKEVAQEKVIEQKVETETVEAAAATELSITPEEKKDPAAPVTEVKTDAPSPDDKPVVELTLDLPVDKTETKAWINTAKEALGVEITEDTPEAFAAASKQALAMAEDRGKQTTLDKELATLSPEAQVDFILLRDGYTRAEIEAPTKEIDAIMAMSNIDIVRKDLELKGLSEELIEKEIEILTDKGIVDHEAEKLKVVLQQARESVLKDREELAKSVATNYEAKRNADRISELQSVNTSLENIKDFMGFTINDANKAEIARRNLEGQYESIFKDPEKRARFILFDMFGEQAVKGIRKNAFDEGRSEVTKHLSNIPPTPKHNNSTSQVKQSAKTASGFEALQEIFSGQ